MTTSRRVALLVCSMGVFACGSGGGGPLNDDSLTTPVGAPVIEDVQPGGAITATAFPDGTGRVSLRVTAADDGTIVSARIDFPGDPSTHIAGRPTDIREHALHGYPIELQFDRATGLDTSHPTIVLSGTRTAELVLTDETGAESIWKLAVTFPE